MKLKNIYAVILLAGISLSGCTDFLNQDPRDFISEAVYFKTPEQFEAAANNLYGKLRGYQKLDGRFWYDAMDGGTDLSASANDEGRGVGTAPTNDDLWKNFYKYLRPVNQVLDKAKEYSGNPSEIAKSVATAHFFRAYHHFNLLTRFGGIPIVATALDVNSPELSAARNSRYEVVEFILNDLQAAIDLGLPSELDIPNKLKGTLSIEAVKAYKARVLLYEGTWEKYVGKSTDGDGVQSGAGSNGYNEANSAKYIAEAAQLAAEVMASPAFQLWDKREELGDSHLFYLFSLEDATTNPVGFTKADNKEYILQVTYDYNYRTGGANLTHSKPVSPNRKMMDMYLCSDGLPVQLSPLFKGYSTMTSEYENRDLRLSGMIKTPLKKYWGWGKSNAGGGAQYDKDVNELDNKEFIYVPRLQTYVSTGGAAGYEGRKFTTESAKRETEKESFNWPVIRLAEMYLIYAEAMYEKNGKLTDEELDKSINLLRKRAGVAPLTNALIAAHPTLTMLGEIRRERAIELFGEGFRFDDLKRWNIAAEELNHNICTVYAEGTEFETAENPVKPGTLICDVSAFPYGVTTAEEVVSCYSGIATTKPGALIMDNESGRHFGIKHYLQPLPTDQIKLNPNLKQNPEW